MSRVAELLAVLDQSFPADAAPSEVAASSGAPGSGAPPQRLPSGKWLAEIDDDETIELLDGLRSRDATRDGCAAEWSVKLLAQLERRWRTAPGERRKPAPLSDDLLAALERLYRHWPATHEGRRVLLAILVAVRMPRELALLSELMASDPPADPTQLATALWPLLAQNDYDPAPLLPRLLDSLVQPKAAAAALDLMNHLVRHKRVADHPARERLDQLLALLGGLVGRLGQLEERPVAPGESAEQMRDMVLESVALAVPLCDALGLIGDAAAVPRLRQAVSLGHRRLRAEAAAALTRLGDDDGRAELIALAAEPVVRLRVLEYAEELGLLDLIVAEHRSPVARAEAELIAWLAAPSRLGLPPHEIDLLDSRALYWPGFQEPVACFLFRFRYAFPEGSYEGIGIAGPTTYAFTADLRSLSVEDQYAAFAGESATHEEIYQVDPKRLSQSGGLELARLERRARDGGFEQIEPVSLGLFLGDKDLIARAMKGGEPGTVVVDPRQEHWFAAGGPRGLGPQEAYAIVKGRRLLAAFNPEFVSSE